MNGRIVLCNGRKWNGKLRLAGRCEGTSLQQSVQALGVLDTIMVLYGATALSALAKKDMVGEKDQGDL